MTKEVHASQVLKNLSDELDIPDSHYEKATERYESFGRFLHRFQSAVLTFRPHYSPQGSFALGTVTKAPRGQRPCYDLDSLASLTALTKDRLTQQVLKGLLGLEVKAYAEENGMKKPAHEGNRCWTIEYSDDDVDFHIDILPAIPDDLASKRAFILSGVPEHLAALAVAITDQKHDLYCQITNDWPRSNPKGFAAWFTEVMKPARRMMLAERFLTASIDDVPTYRWRTPLQRAVQMIKRHRDTYFADDADNKPASIIVTTLAALCYDNQLDIYEAMRAIIDGMPGKIEVRGGVFWIPNPVNPMENFADRWKGEQRKALACYQWLGALRTDFEELVAATSMLEMGVRLKSSFGDDAAKGTLMRMGSSVRQDRVANRLRIEPTGILGATGRPVRNHTFYGQAQD